MWSVDNARLRQGSSGAIRNSCYLTKVKIYLQKVRPGKGVLGFQSPTGGWVGRSACSRQKKKRNPLQNDLKMVLEGHPL